MSMARHLRDNLIPFLEQKDPRNDCIFVQDSAPSHRANNVQNFLKEKFNRPVIKTQNGLPHHPTATYRTTTFGTKLRGYEDPNCNPFKNEDELRNSIIEVWGDCAKKFVKFVKFVKL